VDSPVNRIDANQRTVDAEHLALTAGKKDNAMEHRLTDRYPSDYPIEISQNQRRVLQARIRNISKHGALVETQGEPLACQGHIQLELPGRDDTPQRIRGVVIHREDTKLGVMFLDAWSAAEWDALSDTIRYADNAARAHAA
jgi:PilZ domain